MTKPPGKSKVVRKLRCAVYTRKSSEEGLEQEFNSLHAQREACEAYIASQRSEGWVLVRDQYDDGGISGGTLERPGLKRLLEDIEILLADPVIGDDRGETEFLRFPDDARARGDLRVNFLQAVPDVTIDCRAFGEAAGNGLDGLGV